MGFIFERIKKEDAEKYNSFNLLRSPTDTPILYSEYSEWVIDKENDMYLIYLGGSGPRGEIPERFCFVYKDMKINITAIAKKVDSDFHFKLAWHIKKEFTEKIQFIENNIHLAFKLLLTNRHIPFYDDGPYITYSNADIENSHIISSITIFEKELSKEEFVQKMREFDKENSYLTYEAPPFIRFNYMMLLCIIIVIFFIISIIFKTINL